MDALQRVTLEVSFALGSWESHMLEEDRDPSSRSLGEELSLPIGVAIYRAGE